MDNVKLEDTDQRELAEKACILLLKVLLNGKLLTLHLLYYAKACNELADSFLLLSATTTYSSYSATGIDAKAVASKDGNTLPYVQN